MRSCHARCWAHTTVTMSASDSKADIEVAESAGQVTSGDEGKAAEGDTGFDAGTKKLVQKLPLFSINAGPRDGNEWKKRLKQEYQALIRVRKWLK